LAILAIEASKAAHQQAVGGGVALDLRGRWSGSPSDVAAAPRAANPSNYQLSIHKAGDWQGATAKATAAATSQQQHRCDGFKSGNIRIRIQRQMLL